MKDKNLEETEKKFLVDLIAESAQNSMYLSFKIKEQCPSIASMNNPSNSLPTNASDMIAMPHSTSPEKLNKLPISPATNKNFLMSSKLPSWFSITK